MKQIILVALIALILVGCEDAEWEDIWELKTVTSGDTFRIAIISTEEQCLSVIQQRTEVNFGAVTSFSASDEEEQGLGLVLICVPARRLVK